MYKYINVFVGGHSVYTGCPRNAIYDFKYNNPSKISGKPCIFSFI